MIKRPYDSLVAGFGSARSDGVGLGPRLFRRHHPGGWTMKKFWVLLVLAAVWAASATAPAVAGVPKVIFDDEFGYPT